MNSAYVTSAILIFLIAALWAYTGDSYYGWFEGCVIAALWTAVLFYPIGSFFEACSERNAELNAQAAASKQAWLDKMAKCKCKRTSYVATKNTITPVWTCPDGTAHLEP